jgi:NACHT domain
MDPGIVVGLLAQVLTELADDLLDSALRPRGAGLVDDPALSRRAGRHRLTGRQRDRLVDQLHDRVASLPGVPEHEQRAAAEAVRESLATAEPFDADLLLDVAGLRADRLEALVRRRSAGLLTAAGLSGAGTVAYDRLLAACCQQLVQFVTEQPQFPARSAVSVVRRLDDLHRDAAERAGEPARRRQDFEHRYAALLMLSLDELELLGVTLSRTPPRYGLSAAYTSLSVARAGGGVDDAELTGSGVDAAAAVSARPRVVLRGTAGSGKTTLLRWLAVTAARRLADETVPSGPRRVPFVLPLRRYADRELPDPAGLLAEAAGPLAHAAPPGWMDEVLRAGRATVLVDGLDELPTRVGPGESRTVRGQAETWLRGLVHAYPAAHFVVTTRTSAVPDGWLEADGFETYDLLPMGLHGVADLVTRWHDGAIGACADPAEQELLADYRDTLPELLVTRPELRQLAGTPLLCALICALNRERRRELPRDRRGIYDAALEMLLDRRDAVREVRAPEGLSFDPREHRLLLRRLAYHLVKNEITEIPEGEAVEQLSQAMALVRPRDTTAQDVYRHLLLRSGLLRADPHSGRVRFLHRTFQDYLGAGQALVERDLGLLVNRAHDDQWRDVVVMAVAQAQEREAGELLAGLLDRGERHPELRERLQLVAALSLEQASVVEPPQVRQRVQRAAAALIPPASAQAAQALAAAGEFVLDLLPGPRGLSDEQAAWVVRTAAQIGTEQARAVIGRFTSPQPSARVVEELLRAWRDTDAEEYARTVLADVDFGRNWVSVRRHRLPYLRHLGGLRAFRYKGDLVELEPLAAVPNLERVHLMVNTVLRDRHLAALAECRSLRELDLEHCDEVTDLSALAGLPLERLGLHFVRRLELGSIAGFGRLAELSVRSVPGLSDLTRVPAGLPLRRLSFGARLPEASLRGLDRFPLLERVQLVGSPTTGDLDQLAALPALRLLLVDGPETAQALAGLRAARPGLVVRAGAVRAA